MTAPLLTPLEALRRLIAEVKQLDAAEVGERWNQLQGELGVAEGAVRDMLPPKGWRETLRNINTEGFGMYSEETARVAIDGCIDALDELEEELSASVAAQPSEATMPIAWGLLTIQDPEITVDSDLANYWMRKDRDVTPLYAAPLLWMQATDKWQLVPKEPTEEMHIAAVRTITRCTGNDDFPKRVFAAMLAAAPPSAGSAAMDASEQISTGYAGGCAYGNEISGHVSLHYKTGEQAEAAFTAITNMIDITISQGEKQ